MVFTLRLKVKGTLISRYAVVFLLPPASVQWPRVNKPGIAGKRYIQSCMYEVNIEVKAILMSQPATVLWVFCQ